MPAAPSKQRKIAIVGSRSVGMLKLCFKFGFGWIVFFLLGGAEGGCVHVSGASWGVTGGLSFGSLFGLGWGVRVAVCGFRCFEGRSAMLD